MPERWKIEEDNSPLCCCEYYNRNDDRFHILGCCCDCVDFDSVCTSIICCRRLDSLPIRNMLLTFQDRLRIPWGGGAKQVTLDAVAPMLVVPLFLAVAATSFTASVCIGLGIMGIMAYSHYFLKKLQPRTKFFFMWAVSSVACMIVLFEITVPLMEILPEENLVLVLLTCGSLLCSYIAKKKSKLNLVVQSLSSEDDLPDIAEEQTAILLDNDEADERDSQSNICQTCRKYVQPRTFHCTVCQGCILRFDHHSYWLDCCIGQHNHCYYFFGMWFGFLALVLCANLTLTSVCHPFLIFSVFGIHVLLPDDCSEIYDQYDISLAFILSVYCLLTAGYIVYRLLQQIYVISRGLTVSEYRRGQNGNRRTILGNWKSFLFSTY